ncbi:hypothetical protein AAVH_42359, partial [Aphelenchoides avenae]
KGVVASLVVIQATPMPTATVPSLRHLRSASWGFATTVAYATICIRALSVYAETQRRKDAPGARAALGPSVVTGTPGAGHFPQNQTGVEYTDYVLIGLKDGSLVAKLQLGASVTRLQLPEFVTDGRFHK